jgi:hypothetical protein
MYILQYAQLAILLFLLIIQIKKRPLLEKVGPLCFKGALVITFSFLFYYSHAQFLVWLAGPPGAYLIPPYQGIGYFVFYVLMRFWAPYLLSAGVAGLFLFAMYYGNRRWQERFFYPDEVYLIALAIFMVGNPLWIGYLLVTLLVYCLYVLTRRVITRKNERVTFYYFWLPIALICIAATPLLNRWQDFNLLKF